jgi:hypothetical protein
MGIEVKRRPWAAIVLVICGVALIVGATIRLKELPFGRFPSAAKQRDPASATAGKIGLLCIALAAWLARKERELDDTNDPADDPIWRLDESDPVARRPDGGKREEPK